MTEFLKNNPNAIRHCLLYEFLRENPAERAFHVFCKTVGKGVIGNEDVEFWFKQFQQGRLGEEDYNPPMTDMRDVFRSDKYALRAAVLFETLKSKKYPFRSDWHRRFYTLERFQANYSFLIFENLCKVIGDDVIKFVEFDYWFYRFLNGESDLDYEREKDKKIYKLEDMPIDVIKEIVKYLDTSERQALAKTCRSVHQFVQDQKVMLDTLRLSIDASSVNITYGSWRTVYTKNDNGCVKQEGKFDMKETFIQGVPFWKQALMDFKKCIKNPKLHLDTLQVYFEKNDRNMDYEEFEMKVIDELEAALKSANELNVKKLIFRASSAKPLLKILLFLNPEYLTTIDIELGDPIGYGMEKVIEIEQWKRAKCLVTRNFSIFIPLRHFYHFNVFNVRRTKIFVNDVREIKEVLFKSPDFEWCSLKFANEIDTFAIKREFSDDFRRYSYHYPIPNTTEYFEIKVSEKYVEISRKKT